MAVIIVDSQITFLSQLFFQNFFFNASDTEHGAVSYAHMCCKLKEKIPVTKFIKNRWTNLSHIVQKRMLAEHHL